MSRTKKRESDFQNPVKHYIQWSGKEGKLFIFDKNKGEKGEKVFFGKLKFAVLDRLHTVTGFQRGKRGGKGKGIYGTEVWNVKEEPMTVWVGGEKQPEGFYEDHKSISGLKYAQSVYIGIISPKDGSMELGRLLLSGSSFSAWLNFLGAREDYKDGEKITDIYGHIFEVTGKSNQKTNGDTKYYEPKFKASDVEEDQIDTLDDLDKELQEYLASRGKKKEEDGEKTKTRSRQEDVEEEMDVEEVDEPAEEEEEEEEEEEVEDATDLDDLPF